MDSHHTAFRHGVQADDTQHAVRNAMTTDALDDDLILYLGPRRDGWFLEVITIARWDGTELAIHAMPMRARYQRLLPEE